MSSKKKLRVEQNAIRQNNKDVFVYRVQSVVNSTTPLIGHTLSRAEVDDYCEREDWEVVVS